MECASVAPVLRPARWRRSAPRRHLLRHIHDLLTVGDQTLRHVPADPNTALDRPDPVRPLPRVREQFGVPLGVGGEPATP